MRQDTRLKLFSGLIAVCSWSCAVPADLVHPLEIMRLVRGVPYYSLDSVHETYPGRHILVEWLGVREWTGCEWEVTDYKPPVEVSILLLDVTGSGRPYSAELITAIKASNWHALVERINHPAFPQKRVMMDSGSLQAYSINEEIALSEGSEVFLWLPMDVDTVDEGLLVFESEDAALDRFPARCQNMPKTGAGATLITEG